ncbi:hypothetical protein [Helicobacter marmotae]|nr:hypothetical protein [Helicobacter marmotae]
MQVFIMCGFPLRVAKFVMSRASESSEESLSESLVVLFGVFESNSLPS